MQPELSARRKNKRSTCKGCIQRSFTIIIAISMLLIVLNLENDVTGSDGSNIFYDQEWTMDMKISDVADGSYYGEYDDDKSGGTSTWLGDINGDGYDDFTVSSPNNDDGVLGGGKIYIFFGHGLPWSQDQNLSNADATIIGKGMSDHMGNVDGIGDVNNDGIDDFAVGSALNDSFGFESGMMFIFFGRTSGWTDDMDLTMANASFVGEYELDRLGSCDYKAGDLNGDGIDDLVMSAHTYSKGDVDNRSTVFMGKTYIFFGKETGWEHLVNASEADASFIGETHKDQSGWFFIGPGDVNDDGCDDLVISANSVWNWGDIKGRSYLIFGRREGWAKDVPLSNANATFIEEEYGNYFGLSSNIGDVNDDGIDDLIFSARFANNGKGRSYLFFGKRSGWKKGTDPLDADVIINGEKLGDQSKMHSFGGDINNDGINDFVIGANGNDDGGMDAGQLYVILGRNDWPSEMDLSMADASFIGDNEGDKFGFISSVAGDINSDGFDDILVSAQFDPGAEPRRGKMYIIMGSDNFSSKPEIELDEAGMKSQFILGMIRGELEILWSASDPDEGTNLNISIYYRNDFGAWIPIEEGLENTGRYVWDTMKPRIPDGTGYSIMVTAIDSTGKKSADIIDDEFGIENLDPPIIEITSPVEGSVLSGTEIIEWEATDDENEMKDLLVDIYISNDGGINFIPVASGEPNNGSYDLDTSRFVDGEYYSIKMKVTDISGMNATDTVNDLVFTNDPSLKILLPVENETLSGNYKIRWYADDATDAASDLKIDLWIRDIITGNESLIVEGITNLGFYDLDTKALKNGLLYRIKIVVHDSDGRNVSDYTPYFWVFNNDAPSVEFTGPNASVTATGEIELTWNSTDGETPDDLVFTLMYKHEPNGAWNTLALNEEDEGSFLLDTLALVEGDGQYTFQLKVKDENEAVSDPSFIQLKIYNPDAPRINWLTGPDSQIRDGKADFQWEVQDPDEGEYDDLKVWIWISSDGEAWIPVVEGILNSDEYEMDVTDLDDGEYFVKLKIADCQKGEYNRSSEKLWDQKLIVNNINDAPVVELVDGPSADIEYSDEITIEWTGSDDDGDGITYTLYYRMSGDQDWRVIQGAEDIDETSFTWDISDMEEGKYQVRIVAQDDFKDQKKTEIDTVEFYIKPVELDIGDDDREVTINAGLMGGIIFGAVVLVIILVWILFINARRREDKGMIEE